MMEKGQDQILDEGFLMTKMPRYFIVTVDKILMFFVCVFLSIFPFFDIKVRVRVRVRVRAKVWLRVRIRVRVNVKVRVRVRVRVR
jgi:hypothetical protein